MRVQQKWTEAAAAKVKWSDHMILNWVGRFVCTFTLLFSGLGTFRVQVYLSLVNVSVRF